MPLAQEEYINAFGTNYWRETIRTSHEQSADHKSPIPIRQSGNRIPNPAPVFTPEAHRTPVSLPGITLTELILSPNPAHKNRQPKVQDAA